jgi:hypothetical protein
VGALIGFCVLTFMTKRECGSVLLPFLGYLLLFGLPLRFG